MMVLGVSLSLSLCLSFIQKVGCVGFVGLIWLACLGWRKWRMGEVKTSQPLLVNEKELDSEDVYYQIEPLADFDVDATEPIKIRPFKPKYHLTMAIENLALSDFIAMDKTYRERVRWRSQLIQDHRSDVLRVNPKAYPAVQEMYSWMTGTYLPQRFPTMFRPATSGLHNLITSEMLPTTAPSAEEALRLLGGTVDADLLFLLPSPDPRDEGKYRLEAFVTCCPSGFNTPLKLNLKLADIHGPVPGYAAKLEKSMDRFFSTLPAGKIVKRVNWSITTNTELFCLAGNHLAEEDKAEALKRDAEIDIDTTVLRCERQTLHRLPQTKALVFAFKTYQYPIRMIKEEGLGEELAQAIDGLMEGSVPGMATYKMAVVWGGKVKEFLRS